MTEAQQKQKPSTAPGGSLSPYATSDKIVTGLDAVQVYVEEKRRNTDKTVLRAYAIMRGERLPANLLDGEEERLEAMGAFEEETPRMNRIRQRQLRRRQAETAGETAPGTPQFADAPGEENNPRTPWMGAPPSDSGTALVTGPRAQEVVDKALLDQARTTAPPPDAEGEGQKSKGPTKADLDKQAADLDIEGRSSMNKEQLEEAIAKAEAEKGQHSHPPGQ